MNHYCQDIATKVDINKFEEEYEAKYTECQLLKKELYQTRKALLIACLKLGYAYLHIDELEGDYVRYDSQEERHADCIYHQYTMPKEYAREMLKLATTNEFDMNFNLTLDNWKTEIDDKLEAEANEKKD